MKKKNKYRNNNLMNIKKKIKKRYSHREIWIKRIVTKKSWISSYKLTRKNAEIAKNQEKNQKKRK